MTKVIEMETKRAKRDISQKDLEMIVTCKHCMQFLWRMKILSHHDGKPISQEWISFYPEHYPHGAPKNYTCPLCMKPFAKEIITRSSGVAKQYQLRVVYKDTIRWI